MYLGVIRSRPTAYSKVTIQHSHLNRKNITQNQKYDCKNNQHFNFQLTHTTLKNVELLKHFKISKTAPTCFGLQGNRHQGATTST